MYFMNVDGPSKDRSMQRYWLKQYRVVMLDGNMFRNIGMSRHNAMNSIKKRSNVVDTYNVLRPTSRFVLHFTSTWLLNTFRHDGNYMYHLPCLTQCIWNVNMIIRINSKLVNSAIFIPSEKAVLSVLIFNESLQGKGKVRPRSSHEGSGRE
jgi:hypothetical protein